MADLLSSLITVSYSTDDIKNILDDYDNIVYVDHGTTRVVIEAQNSSSSVYKVSYSSEGERANETEINRFKASKSVGCEQLLLPILDSGDGSEWVKMPKLDEIPNIVREDPKKCHYGPESEQIMDLLHENGICVSEIETGLFNGKVVAYDYGD